MKITDEITVEEGMVIGHVSTNKIGSECSFEVCTVEEYEAMTEDEAMDALEESMWESGYCNLNF